MSCSPRRRQHRRRELVYRDRALLDALPPIPAVFLTQSARALHRCASMETTSATPQPTTGCCPPFDPASWQKKEVTWKDKPFVKEHVHSLFRVPLDMGRKISKTMQLAEKAHARPARTLMLSDERSPWGSDLYIDVAGPVPGADVIPLSGTFMTKVYEGPFRDAPKWAADMRAYVAANSRTMNKLYFGYTTCPRCAKAYGRNYVVLFADVTTH